MGLLSLAALCAAAERPYVAVIEKAAGYVGFFAEDGRSLARVKVGSFPHEAVLSSDGRLLYVSDNGVLWMTEDAMGGNTISILDVQTMQKIGTIDLGRFHRPHGLALMPGSKRLLATTERPYGLIMIDPDSRKVVRDYDVKGKSPHMVMPAPQGGWAFVSDTDSGVVAAIELSTGQTRTIPTGAAPQGGIFSPKGDRLYITNRDANTISILDTATRKVVSSIATGKGPARVAITPDGRTLIYNLQFDQAVGFADVASGKQTTTVALTGRPLSLTLSRDGRRAFTGIQDQDKVVFLSVPSRKIERTIALEKGSGPDPVIVLP